jgi:predicted RNase H-like nuclease (RuvC/YqgF family)
MGPAVQQGAIPAKIATEIYSAFARTFRLGKSVEDALAELSEQANQPQEPQIPPEVQQQMQQGMEMIQQLQQQLAQVTQENQRLKADQSVKQADMQMRAQSHVQDMQIKAESHDADMAMQVQKMQQAAMKPTTPMKGN